ncbi:MAG: 6-carboxytetrahydropterin synthase [Abditibacteriota bacterium]|nr:6-carboxytetrahydropterin synthase [Abditibacteriota bacterium]
MYEIYIEQHFNAAHYLRGYNGPCSSLHGHSYKTGLVFKLDSQDDTGISFDFVEAKRIAAGTMDYLDHTCLNDLEAFKEKNPTAENIARYIYDSIKREVPELWSVSVWESATTCATYYE